MPKENCHGDCPFCTSQESCSAEGTMQEFYSKLENGEFLKGSENNIKEWLEFFEGTKELKLTEREKFIFDIAYKYGHYDASPKEEVD